MYIDDCLLGTTRIMESDILDPINLGSSELVTINQLVDIVEEIAGVRLKRRYDLDAPKGVRGRNSDNTLIRERLGWEPSTPLATGLERTYAWIYDELAAAAPVVAGRRRDALMPARRPAPAAARAVISIILYGRNDAHGYNLHRRAALSLNCLAEVLTDADDEIVFVDYNTPDELPTFVEAIADTLTDRVPRPAARPSRPGRAPSRALRRR